MSKSPIELFVDDLDAEQVSDLVGIVVSQDPTELSGGSNSRPRWNAGQRELILGAQKSWEEAGLEIGSGD